MIFPNFKNKQTIYSNLEVSLCLFYVRRIHILKELQPQYALLSKYLYLLTCQRVEMSCFSRDSQKDIARRLLQFKYSSYDRYI